MSRKKSKKNSSPNDELERLLASHEERYSTWHRYNELGGSDPTWPDGANMNLVRNHIIYDKERLKELIPDGNLPAEYYLPTPPVVDNNYLAPKGEYFKQRLKRLNETKERVTTVKQPDVDLRVGELF